MRKRLFGALAALLVMLLTIPAALADEMEVRVTANPTELSDAGTVAFTFAVANRSDYEMSNLTITYDGQAHEILKDQAIPMNGEARDIVLSLPVTQAQLGKPIQFQVSAVRSGETITRTAEITINRSADPAITAERTISADKVKQGETVKLTYVLKNETKFDMTDITLIDENISDNAILKLDKLLAGATYTMDHEFKMGEQSVSSAPFITYTVNGKTKTFSGIEQKQIDMLLVKVDLKVEAGAPTPGGVTFTLTAKNTGNQDVNSITIRDEKGNTVVNAPFSLKPGDTATYTHQVTPDMNEQIRNVRFFLSGTDALGGPYSLEGTEAYPVQPYVEDSQINVTVRAETVAPWSTESGAVTLRLIIENYSQVNLTDVTVTETVFGELKKLDGFLAKAETSFDQTLSMGSPRNLQFTVKGTDPTGTVRTLGTCALAVAYGEETASPESTAAPEQDANMYAFQFLSSTISKILVGLGVLMVVAFIVLITLSISERSRTGGSLLFKRYDEEDGEGDELDDLFDDLTQKSPKERELREDTDQALYESRMRTGSRRREPVREEPGGNEAAIQLPPPLDAAKQPSVPIAYEDSYEGQRSYAPRQETERREPVQAKRAERQERYVLFEEDGEDDGSYGENRPPKVIEKQRPAVVPKSRNQVRRVGTKEDQR